MSKDITSIIEGWEYKPDEISVRKIRGDDGKEKIQLRLDLGLLQMEMEGRPDGQRPYGYESLLEYYLALIEEHKARYGTDENFHLDREDCARLQREAIQYYHRYLSLFHLGEYEGVKRDTARNLRVFDLVKKYAVNEEDKWAFEQYRPYVIMMNTRAKGLISLEKKNYDEALHHIRDGIRAIEQFFKEYNRSDLMDASPELAFLKRWAKEVEESRPLTEIERLRKQLQQAIEREEYEKAAELRDQIRKLLSSTN